MDKTNLLGADQLALDDDHQQPHKFEEGLKLSDDDDDDDDVEQRDSSGYLSRSEAEVLAAGEFDGLAADGRTGGRTTKRVQNYDVFGLSGGEAPAATRLQLVAVALRNALRWTSMFYMVFSFVRAVVGMAIFYSLFMRAFVYVPFAAALVIDWLVAGLGASVFRRRSSSSGAELAWQAAEFVAVLVWLVLSLVMYDRVFSLLLDTSVISDGFFEPTPSQPLNDSLAGTYHTLVSYYAVTIVSSLLLAVLALLHLALIGFHRVDDPAPSPVLGACYVSHHHQPLFRWAGLLVFAVVVATFAVFLLAGVADYVAATSSAGYCDPAGEHPDSTRCYLDCDPIDPTECLYPFPSSFWQAPSNRSTVTGVLLRFPPAVFPQQRAGNEWTIPRAWEELDGWSVVGPLLFYLPNATDDGFPAWSDISQSLLDQRCPVVLLEADTGRRVPIFVELDRVDPDSPSIIVQPARPLRYATRHVVGVRGVRSAATGEAVPPSPAMQQLRNRTYTPQRQGGLSTRQRHQHYWTNIFPLLAADGFDVERDVQLAWDFTTYSQQQQQAPALRYLADALARLERGEVTYTVTDVQEADCQGPQWNTTNGRVIWGYIDTPLYLDSTERLAGFPRPFERSIESPRRHTSQFVVAVPCSLLRQPQTAPLLLEYGHGLFGSRDEVLAGFVRSAGNANKWIHFASDWYGMAGFDVLAVSRILIGDMTAFAGLPEAVLQGWIDKAVLLRTVVGRLAADPLLRVGDVPLVDVPSGATKLGYYGNSQGGILGGGYLGFSPDHRRALLGVPGSPYALLLGRSRDFHVYSRLLSLSLYTWRHQRITLTLMGLLWDKAESAGWFPNVADSDKRVLIHAAVGDQQVTTLGAHIMARAYRAATLAPQTRPIYGVDQRSGPELRDGNVIVEWQYDNVGAEPVANVPPPGPDPHECPRREPAFQRQMRRFFEEDVVAHECDGPCIRPACNWH